MSWLVEPEPVSDHPSASICAGENWTVRQINAVMSNPTEWAHTVIFLTWDDFGVLYDHVGPPSGPDATSNLGLRSPSIVISPFAKPGFIDHTQYTFDSLLKFIEDTFNLSSLTSQDGQANDMRNSFDFAQKTHPPQLLQPRADCPGLPFVATVEKPLIAPGDTETVRAYTTPGMRVFATMKVSAARTLAMSAIADKNGLAIVRFAVPPGTAGRTLTIVLTSPYRVHAAVRTVRVTGAQKTPS